MDDLVLSVHAILAARFLVQTIRQAVSDLVEHAEVNLTSALHLLHERATTAILLLGRTAGERLESDTDKAHRTVLSAWRKQPDFEQMIVESINLFFNAANLERLLEIGQRASDAGICTPGEAVAATVRMLGWNP